VRIALVTTTFFPQVGGAETVVHNLASEWVRQGHEVCVFNQLTNETTRDAAGYTVRKFARPISYLKLAPHRFPFSQYVAGSLRRHLNEFKPDFISAHFGYPIGVWLSHVKPLPNFLVTCHGREITKFPWGDRNVYKIDKVLAAALNRSSGVVAISSHARRLLEELGVRPEKIIDIPNGVDIARYREQAGVDFRGRFGIPREAVVILSVGREHAQKAYDVGIRAFAEVAGKIPGAYYVILGRGSGKWQSLVEELALRGRVILSDGLRGDDLVAAYQQADIFFSPSIWELMPLVVLEAMAAGLPLVVTNVSGSQDLVQTGENGMLVEPGDVGEMASALLQLAGDQPLRQRWGGINLAGSDNYSWDRISRMYLEHR
jgi:glycosyltransferase involved in cell wall biosynthesis